ncbi:rhoptry-associated membrane antigen, putative [Plasmodium berghei]|uniref:Rhoptry-associated membrane antigen, putative n=1 Tax=Plasmodium berghei TaxID=5821 RepID=A0A1D3PYZ9_PLABE|nr:rhoptry-associated membrane antigen, putative [Plasmodium berghei]
MNTLLLSLLVFQNITTYFDNFKNAGIIESNGGEIKYISENIVGTININGIHRQLNDDIENGKYNFNSGKYYYDSNAHKDYYDANDYRGEISFLETDEYDEADNEKDDDNENEESFLETDEYDEADNEKDHNDFESDEDNYADDISSSTTAQSFIEKNEMYFDDFFDSEETIKDAVKKGSKNNNSSTSSRNDSTINMINKLNKTGNTEFENKNSFNEEPQNKYEFSDVKSDKNKQSLRSQNKNAEQSNLKDIKAKNTQNNMGQIDLEEYEITNDEIPSDNMSDAYDAFAPTLHKKEKSNNESTKYKLKNNNSTKDPKYVPYKKGENIISPHIHTDIYKKNKKTDEMLEEYEQELSNDDMMELESHNEEDTPVIAETENIDGNDDSKESNSSSISFLSSLTIIILGLLYIMN